MVTTKDLNSSKINLYKYVTTSTAIVLDRNTNGVAEMTVMPGEEEWFFSRLIVPVKHRGNGVATEVMHEMIKLFKEHKIVRRIVLGINAYGGLFGPNYDQLVKFYSKFGFRPDPDSEGMFLLTK